MKKTAIFLASGGCLFGWTLKEWIDESKFNKEINFPLLLWKSFPARCYSQVWGYFSRIQFPSFLQRRIIEAYASRFNCNLQESEKKDCSDYKSLNEFFVRRLQQGKRPICQEADVVSCSDGKIVAFGALEDDLQQRLKSTIKGMNFGASSLLGQTPKKVKEENRLFYYVVYLGPGDYHHFHSPFNVSFSNLGHFNGELMPVKPKFVGIMRSLFVTNERISLCGAWEHGFAGFVPVAALGVGNIVIKDVNAGAIGKKSLVRSRGWIHMPVALSFAKGKEVGRFELGSTVAVIFEAPASFSWTVSENETVRVGCPLGKVLV
jgi:phosphatidylserine decarboxylase